jgi:hypothetical protein
MLRRDLLLGVSAFALAPAAGAKDDRHMRDLKAWELESLQGVTPMVHVQRTYPVSAERLFEVLGAPEPWPEWFGFLTRVRYLTPDPKGVGTERDVTTRLGTIREHFVAWQAPARFAFYVRETNVVGLKRFAEDYRIEALADDGCRLDWRVYGELAGWARPFEGMVRAQGQRMFDRAAARLEQWLRDNPPS